MTPPEGAGHASRSRQEEGCQGTFACRLGSVQFIGSPLAFPRVLPLDLAFSPCRIAMCLPSSLSRVILDSSVFLWAHRGLGLKRVPVGLAS